MHKQLKNLEHVNGNYIIWKYMGIEKFLHLVSKSQLFFSRLSKMTDRYEGTLPKQNVRARLEQLSRAGNKDALEQLNRERKEIESHIDKIYINCWTLDTEESYALWKIYLRGASSGVAIKTTVGRLRNAIEVKSPTLDFYTGKVNYTNFLKEYPPDHFTLTTTKSKFYGYEKELRVFLYGKFLDSSEEIEKLLPGQHVNVELDTLIEKIYLSPFTGSWFYDSFRDFLDKMNPDLADKIEFSEIDDQ